MAGYFVNMGGGAGYERDDYMVKVCHDKPYCDEYCACGNSSDNLFYRKEKG